MRLIFANVFTFNYCIFSTVVKYCTEGKIKNINFVWFIIEHHYFLSKHEYIDIGKLKHVQALRVQIC